ncbi:MAG: DUF1353 domain-containing protein [Acidimicrobiales bacterium]
MGFEGRVVVTPIPPEGKRWRLVEPFLYRGKRDLFSVPRGFTTDFASVPRVVVWLLPRYGRWTQAAILHDYLWALAREGQVSRVDADGLFYRALRELQVPFLRRWMMWAAVRLAAGPRSWMEAGPASALKVLTIAVPGLAFVAVPALFVMIALVIGMLAEYLVYGVTRLLGLGADDDFGKPDGSEVWQS